MLNKTDIASVVALEAEDRAAIAEMQQLAAFAAECNCFDPRLYGELKTKACGLQKEHAEMEKSAGKSGAKQRNLLQVITPKKRDDVERPAYVPEDLLKMEAEAELTTCKKELLRIKRDYEAYNRGELPRDDFMKTRDKCILDNDEWRYDTIPEIYKG